MRWHPLWRKTVLKETKMGNFKFEGKDAMLIFKKIGNVGYAVVPLAKISGQYTHVGGYVFISKIELEELLRMLEKGKKRR